MAFESHLSITSITESTPNLTRDSHQPRQLSAHALAYFDRPIDSWTEQQKQSASNLKTWFAEERVRRDVFAVPTNEISWYIAEIGKIFFLDGLNGVNFYYSDANLIGGATRNDYTAKEVITIDQKHWFWKYRSKCMRWRTFKDVIFHEAIHAFFWRFGPVTVVDAAKQDHHAAWQLIAEAMERRLWTELVWKVNLRRPRALMSEFKKHGELDLTQEELNVCFGDRFKYTERDGSTTNLIRPQPSHELTYRVGPRHLFPRVKTAALSSIDLFL